MLPSLFFIEEKSWNYYPYTITEYACNFFPKFHIHTETRYENNAGTTNNSHDLPPDELEQRVIDLIDIVNDSVADHKYKESEDPSKVSTTKTNPTRGPLQQNWIAELKAKEEEEKKKERFATGHVLVQSSARQIRGVGSSNESGSVDSKGHTRHTLVVSQASVRLDRRVVRRNVREHCRVRAVHVCRDERKSSQRIATT
jgi:hypothetical protein